MNTYESWLNAELEFRKKSILNQIDGIESILKGLRFRVENNGNLNDLGELQGSGNMLDTAIAAYATERQALLNYQEMKK